MLTRYRPLSGLTYLRHLLQGPHQASESTPVSTEIAEHSIASNAVLGIVSKKYFALSAACALFKYIEGDYKGRMPPGSVSLSYQAPEGMVAQRCCRKYHT